MKTIYLKANTKQEIYDGLVLANLAVKTDQEYIINNNISFDFIGDIYNITTQNQNTVATKIPGVHANLGMNEELTPEQIDVLPVIDPPNTPYRAFW